MCFLDFLEHLDKQTGNRNGPFSTIMLKTMKRTLTVSRYTVCIGGMRKLYLFGLTLQIEVDLFSSKDELKKKKKRKAHRTYDLICIRKEE